VNTLLFVYGTLKRGCSNHRYLADQKFVALARTIPGYRLYDLGGYPGIVSDPEDRYGVVGEVWSVDAQGLERLDRFEGVHEGLYRREPLPLQAPFEGQPIVAYVSLLPAAGRPEVGNEWIE
jgi:gamma-glutamylaminecyclotransferase